jgi:hypothetical protein
MNFSTSNIINLDLERFNRKRLLPAPHNKNNPHCACITCELDKHIPIDPPTCLICEMQITSPSARCTRCGFEPGED